MSAAIAGSFEPSILGGKLENIFIGTKIPRNHLDDLKSVIIQVLNLYFVIVSNNVSLYLYCLYQTGSNKIISKYIV